MTFDRVMVGSEFDYFQPTQSGYLVRCVKVGNSRYKVLGSLAYMQIGAVSYVEALFKTSLAIAGALLVGG